MALLLPYTWVDVFAERPLAGNQLAVFAAPADLPLATMQSLTRELNHSETTFIQPAIAAGADLRVRIFIPTLPVAREIPFAGHPILGTACVAAKTSLTPVTLHIETGAGLIPVEVEPLEAGVWDAQMVQPTPQVVGEVAVSQAELARALGVQHADLRSDLPVEAVDNGMQTVIIPLASLAAVQRANPDLDRLRALLGPAGLCTLVFALGGVEAGSDVHCRVFSPFDLVPEDPATGSANGPLGHYLVRHGVLPGPAIVSEQGYQVGRPSRLRITVDPSGKVSVGGRVQLVGRGEFQL